MITGINLVSKFRKKGGLIRDYEIINFRSPLLILSGFGAIERLGPEPKGASAGKALIVTDKGEVDSGIGPYRFMTRKRTGENLTNQLPPMGILLSDYLEVRSPGPG